VFADAAFAQVPFASAGGVTFVSALSESATADSFVSQESLLGGRVDEQAVTAAVQAFVASTLTAAQTETATATAAQNFAASTLTATQAETATGTDAPAFAASILNAAQAEIVRATDLPSAISTVYAAITEIANVLDGVVGSRAVYVSVAESATGSNTQSVIVTFTANASEIATGNDALTVLKTLNVRPTGIQLYVYIGNVLVWEPIDTDQTPPDPNWQNIPT
jgi:hypothetical protein